MLKTTPTLTKLLAVTFSVALLSACGKGTESNAAASSSTAKAPVSTQASEQPQKTSVNMEMLSYSIGYQMGNFYYHQKVAVDVSALAKGLTDGSTGKESTLSIAEMKQATQNFARMMNAKAQQARVQQHNKIAQAVITHSNDLLNRKGIPVVGPQNAKVAVIEFFDYQCAYCSKAAPEMEAIIKANPNVKFIFMDFPIFSSRWPASKYAAQVGLLAYQQGGAKLYSAYHNQLFATGKIEGQLTRVEINRVAEAAGVKIGSNKTAYQNTSLIIDQNMAFAAKKLGLMGTPAFVIMPTSGANTSNTTVIPGLAAQNTLQEAITRANSSR